MLFYYLLVCNKWFNDECLQLPSGCSNLKCMYKIQIMQFITFLKVPNLNNWLPCLSAFYE